MPFFITEKIENNRKCPALGDIDNMLRVDRLHVALIYVVSVARFGLF